MTLRRFLSTFIACFSCISAGSLAQVDYAAGSLNLRVLDSNERLISDAHVMVKNLATGATTEAVVTDEGYQVRSIPPGTYEAEVAAKGFKKSVAGDLVVQLGETARYSVKLDIGVVTESIEVQANLALLQPDQTQQTNIINNVQVESLPNVSRNFVGSVYTLPGVVNSYAPTLQDPGVGTAYLSSGFSMGASNGRNNLVTIDGGEDEYGSGTMREMHVPIDSIREFQVNRNGFEAEFGFTSGSAINMVTKSGTNQFHASAAGYFHNRNTDGGNYFDKLAGLGVKPFEQSLIVSATLGGPIRKSRWFFFTAPEYQQLDAATVQNIAAEQEFQSIASQSNGFDGKSCPSQNTPQQQVTQLCYLTQMANSGGPLSGLGEGLLASSVFGDPFNDPILNALVTSQDGTFDGIPASPVGSGVRRPPRPGHRSAPIARAASTPWSSSCRANSPNPSWSASAGRPTACFRNRPTSSSPAVVRMAPRCASMSRRRSTALARVWTLSRNCCFACVRSTPVKSSPFSTRPCRRPAVAALERGSM